jgi:hypothetical protein
VIKTVRKLSVHGVTRPTCSRAYHAGVCEGDVPQVPRPNQRVLEYRTLNIRRWNRIVETWAARDDQALDDAWIDQIIDLGSHWGQYEYVTNIGFAA